ncbi:MAG TPA: GNAT family N-acetyltransferase [Candidatus Limnocylindrales bacterium]|nr:GNAT family N-acetyltransferase [Candidatus Limnocylindrales bacterium]
MPELTMRPLNGPDELDLFCRLPYVLNDELEGDLAHGRRRLDWMWVAQRGDQLIARAAWWTYRRGEDPAVLDVFDIADDADPEDGEQLLRAAMTAVLPAGATPPEAIRFVPPNWRDDEAVRRGVEACVAALESTGARLFVERLRLQWDAGTPVAPPTERLAFREPESREELVGLMTTVLEGTLDAHSRAELGGKPAAQVAAEQHDDEFLGYSSPRSWWRIATLPDGNPIGFVIPARNAYNPILAYIGILPTHRGKGYIDDVLAEGTRILAANGAPRIRASTDVGNVPMARAFARAGYRTFERQLNLVWT